MRATVAKPQGDAREGGAERSGRQNRDTEPALSAAEEKTNPQRGRVRAASVRANAKPEVHQDAPGRAGWRAEKVQALTRGDLPCESRGEVSRGRSSDDARRKAGTAKGRSIRNMAQLEATRGRPETSGTRRVAIAAASAARHDAAEPVQPGRAAAGEVESLRASQSHRKP